MPACMKADESPNPKQVSFLGLQTVVAIANRLTQLIEQPRRMETWTSAGIHNLVDTVNMNSNRENGHFWSID
jgi:hypothetical protein